MILQPFQRRVVEEKNDLDNKLCKLATFINSPAYAELSMEEQSRLDDQRHSMVRYSGILGDRIVAFQEGETALAGRMYEAYCASVGGKAVNGDPLPAWCKLVLDESKAGVVEAWKAAARAAYLFLV